MADLVARLFELSRMPGTTTAAARRKMLNQLVAILTEIAADHLDGADRQRRMVQRLSVILMRMPAEIATSGDTRFAAIMAEAAVLLHGLKSRQMPPFRLH